MKAYPPILLLAILLSSGCSDDGATQISQPKQLDEHPGDAQDSNPYAGRAIHLFLLTGALSEIMGDFASPIDTYPVIDQDETVVRQNGRTYRRGLEDEPFNGTVVETFPDGSLSLSTTFYQGKPHGFQKRNFPNGNLALEVFSTRESFPEPRPEDGGTVKSGRRSIGARASSRAAGFGMPKEG